MVLYGGIGDGSERIRFGTWAQAVTHVGIAVVLEKKPLAGQRWKRKKAFTWKIVAGTVKEHRTQLLAVMEMANHPAPDLVHGDSNGGFQTLPLLWKIGSNEPDNCFCRVIVLPAKEKRIDVSALQTMSSCLRTVRMRYQLTHLPRLLWGALGKLKLGSWQFDELFCSEFVGALGLQLKLGNQTTSLIDLTKLRDEYKDRFNDQHARPLEYSPKPSRAPKFLYAKNVDPSPENLSPIMLLHPKVAPGYNHKGAFDIDLGNAKQVYDDRVGKGLSATPEDYLKMAASYDDDIRAPVIAARGIYDISMCKDNTAGFGNAFVDNYGWKDRYQITPPALENIKKRLEFARRVMLFYEGDVTVSDQRKHLRVLLIADDEEVEFGLSLPNKARWQTDLLEAGFINYGWNKTSFYTAVYEKAKKSDFLLEKESWEVLTRKKGYGYQKLFVVTCGGRKQKPHRKRRSIMSSITGFFRRKKKETNPGANEERSASNSSFDFENLVKYQGSGKTDPTDSLQFEFSGQKVGLIQFQEVNAVLKFDSVAEATYVKKLTRNMLSVLALGASKGASGFRKILKAFKNPDNIHKLGSTESDQAVSLARKLQAHF